MLILGINDVQNCESDIDQINNILRNIKHIAYECGQYGGVTNVFLSGLTLTNRLPEQTMKDFNISPIRII